MLEAEGGAMGMLVCGLLLLAILWKKSELRAPSFLPLTRFSFDLKLLLLLKSASTLAFASSIRYECKLLLLIISRLLLAI